MSQGSTIHSNQPFADLQARQPMAWDSLSDDVVGLINALLLKGKCRQVNVLGVFNNYLA